MKYFFALCLTFGALVQPSVSRIASSYGSRLGRSVLENDTNITNETSQISHQTLLAEEKHPYIVLLNTSHIQLNDALSRLNLTVENTTYIYNNTAFKGFLASITRPQLRTVRGWQDVRIFEQNGKRLEAAISDIEDELPANKSRKLSQPSPKAHVLSEIHSKLRDEPTIQPDSPWSLQRISSKSVVTGDMRNLTFNYTYDGILGDGVDVYILGGGIATTHPLLGGRVREGFSSVRGGDNDWSAKYFSTMMAGTIAAQQLGVASGANIINVRVLKDGMSGTLGTILAGLDYIMNEHSKRRKEQGYVASVVMVGLGGGGDSEPGAIEQSLAAIVQLGVHAVLSAGNEGANACNITPGKIAQLKSNAIVVGAIDAMDSRSSFTNTGPCVDVYAPGQDIWSTGAEGDQIYTIDGTSSAAAIVAGVVAYWAANRDDLALDPGAMKRHMLDQSIKNILTGDKVSGDRGYLINNGQRGSHLVRG